MNNNKRRSITTMVMALLCIAIMHAIPAKRGLWGTITLTDGTHVKAELIGDEHFHCYRDSLKNLYIAATDTTYTRATENTVQMSRMNIIAKQRQMLKSQQKLMGEEAKQNFFGKKKGLIILVNFADNSFSETNANEIFNDIANKRNYHNGNYKESVSDYFLAQSDGKFELDFDVVGPVTLSNQMSYYGGNNSSGNDRNPGAMVKEACLLADSLVNFADYDWDGDGEVDQVFILYAGYNEAESNIRNSIWPHEWNLTSTIGSTITLDGTVIDTYACSSEFKGSSGASIAGIGSICHEFSHCLGFPDTYDVNYGGNFGMGGWDLMCSGNYNNDSFVPAGYTSYEKMLCGWLKPIELTDSCKIKGMKPLSEGGESYVIYCDNSSKNEYYLLENKNETELYDDTNFSYPDGKGLLILHVDYNKDVWDYNMVNAVGSAGSTYNSHQRLTIFHADNSDSYIERDTYPYNGNNSLTSTSTPAATQYNGGNIATKLENKEITDITKHADGSIDFTFKLAKSDSITYKSLYLNEDTEDSLTFADGTYNVRTNRLFKKGEWTSLWLPFNLTMDEVKEHFGDNTKVAKFTGIVNTNDSTVITFDVIQEGIQANVPYLLKVNNNDELTDIGNFQQKEVKGSENKAEITIDGSTAKGIYNYNDLPQNVYYMKGDSAIALSTGSEAIKALQAYFVTTNAVNKIITYKVTDSETTGIESIRIKPTDMNADIYNINGQLIRKGTTGLNNLPKGIYIVNGKKYIVK